MWTPVICLLSICVTLSHAINLYPPPKRATLGERPFQAAIFKSGIYHCSGALISSHCVLTACSCIDADVVSLGETKNIDANYTLLTRTVSLGDGDMNWELASELYIVNGCNRETNENDAAILCSDAELSGRPQTMVTQRTNEGVRGIASGWGISMDGEEDLRDHLRRAYMRIISLDECRERYAGIREVPDSALCAVATDEVRGFCAGDFGGPLTHGEGVIGVTVTSFGCEERKLPGIFTNVSRISASVQEVVDKFESGLEYTSSR